MVVIYYYHIPKCAGTFINTNMRKLAKFRVSKHVVNDYVFDRKFERVTRTRARKSRKKFFSNEDRIKNSVYFNFTSSKEKSGLTRDKFNAINTEVIQHFLENVHTLPYLYVYIHHHVGYPGLGCLLQDISQCRLNVSQSGGKFFLFTTVREIISYTTSRVNYRKQRGFNHSDFEPLITLAEHQNKQSKFLIHNNTNQQDFQKDLDIDELKPYVHCFDKMYTIENIAQVKKDFCDLLDADIPWSTEHKNVTKKVSLMINEQKERLIQANPLDIWLYDYAIQTELTNS